MMHLINQPGFWGRVPKGHERQRTLAQGLGFELTFFVMGDEEDENAPAAVALKMSPGATIFRHSHSCHRLEVVAQGSLKVGDRVLVPGDVMESGDGDMYGPHIAGPDGCVTYEIFSTLKGLREVTYESENGIITVNVAAKDPYPADLGRA